MLRFTLTLTCLLGVMALTTFAQDKTSLPKGPPPEFARVQELNKEKGTLVVMSPTTVHITRTKEQDFQVMINGKLVTERRTIAYTEPQLVFQTVSYAVNADNVFATDAAGKKLTKAELTERLTPGKMILISRSEQGLDPAYRSVLAKDTVILVVAPAKKPEK